MHIQGRYLADCNTTFTYDVDVDAPIDRWIVAAAVKAEGRVIAIPYTTLDRAEAGPENMEMIVHSWMAEFIDSEVSLASEEVYSLAF